MGDGLTIRRAAEEDYESVRVLEELEFQMHRAARPDYFKEAAETYGRGEFLGLLSMPCPIAWLAEWSGQVVALCLGKIGRSTDSEICKSRKVASVEDLVTLPEFRGRGIGTALLERAREQAREEGAESLELHVWDFNHSAIRLYKRAGMRVQYYRMEEPL